jgi:hypothetical protein
VAREHQIERLVLRGVDVLERALDDLDLGEAGQIAAPDGGQRRPRLDARIAKASAAQRQRRLGRGAPDLQQAVIAPSPAAVIIASYSCSGYSGRACW